MTCGTVAWGLQKAHSSMFWVPLQQQPSGPPPLLPTEGNRKRCCVSITVPKLPAPSPGHSCTQHPCPHLSMQPSWKMLPLLGFPESLGTSLMQGLRGHPKATNPGTICKPAWALCSCLLACPASWGSAPFSPPMGSLPLMIHTSSPNKALTATGSRRRGAGLPCCTHAGQWGGMGLGPCKPRSPETL